ncbi:YeiH family protein [Tepidibacter hydrothermalis]|uniref:Sulfate exporter family transporter n=1 Tax=Tepidibacter hydrothermalis TaxID=3036126 RepID=A0ABY8E8I9_9FIRM|nr:putative sulfate exporter family transporter [Tepidibacter hydrothermalis]WFD09215.1 putative sulfate exporter family transporter [Tepidibacter hydrothermalis]
MEKIKKLLPGLLFVFLISIISMFINDGIKHIINLEALTIGIILGIIYNNTFKTSDVLKPGITFSLKTLLKWGIVLLGFKLNFRALMELGPEVVVMIILYVPSVLILSYLLGKIFKMNNKVAVLLGVGSSICGASAVVAMSSCINAEEDDSIVAVSIINFLGAIGVLVYSTIAITSGMSNLEYGVWSGISLQGVAHAIAAAFARGDQSGEIGTLVKMGRVVMLVPVSLALSYVFNRGNKESKVKFPMYILYFILAGIISSLNILSIGFINILSKLSSVFILMAMVGMGLSVNIKAIKDKGMKALIMGSLLFLIISITMHAVSIYIA